MIKKAISFTEIRVKLERREYGNVPNPTAPSGILKLISDDFKQLFFNAKRYNMKGSNIYNDARKLDRLHRETYAKLAGIAPPEPEEDQKPVMAGGSGQGQGVKAEAGGSDDEGDEAAGTPGAGGGVQNGPAPPKKKKKVQPPPDEKPITLTKWLNNKVDDLAAMTDKT